MHPALEILMSRPVAVATAESCTGGQLAATLTAEAGSSAYYHWGVVTYSNLAKQDLLGVPADLFESVGAVSQAVADAMARGALQRSGSQYAISTTGIAGPGGGSESKPVGTVWFGLAWIERDLVSVQTERMVFAGSRQQIQRAAVTHALDLLGKRLGS